MIRTASFLFVTCLAAAAAAQTPDVGAAEAVPQAAAPAQGTEGAQSRPAGAGSAEAPVPAGPGAEIPADKALAGPFVVGAAVGALFPQVFTALGSHVVVGLEVGYRLPYLSRRFEIKGEVGYSPPGNSTTITRSEGAYQAEVVSQQLHFSLGPRVRLLPGASRWNATVAAGLRVFLLESTSNGSREGESFVEFTERSTEVGLFTAVGAEYMLGPGGVFLDLNIAWAGLSHRITGDVSTGSLALVAGYRLFL